MENKDKQRFFEIMFGLADNFGGTISKEGLAMRFDALSEHTIEDVAKAATNLIRYRKKEYPPVPTVQEMLDVIAGFERPTQALSAKAQAEIEVDKVLRKLKYFGRNAPVDFENEITFHLMTTRWKYNDWASTVEEKDLVWFRKEFVEAFCAYAECQRHGGMIGDMKECLPAPEVSAAVMNSANITGLVGKIGKSF